MQAIDTRANSAGMAVASAYAVGALFDTLIESGILTREQAAAALHDALTASGHRAGTPKGSKPPRSLPLGRGISQNNTKETVAPQFCVPLFVL